MKIFVSVELTGFTFINYTMNGKMSGARDGEISSTLEWFRSVMEKTGYKIVEETKRELSKHKLPYDEYEIKVIQGYLI